MKNYSYKNFVMPDDCVVFPRTFFEDSWLEVLSYEYLQLLIYGWTRATVAGFWNIMPKDTAKVNFAKSGTPLKHILHDFVKLLNFDNKDRAILINNDCTIFFVEYIDTHRCGTLILSNDSDSHIYREMLSNGLSENFVRQRYNIVDDLSEDHQKRLTAQISENIRKKVRVSQRDYDAYLDFNIVPLHEKCNVKVTHNERILYYNNLVSIYYEAAKTTGKYLDVIKIKSGIALFHVWFVRYFERDYAMLVNFLMENRYKALKIELATIINCQLYKFPQERWAELTLEPLVRLQGQ